MITNKDFEFETQVWTDAGGIVYNCVLLLLDIIGKLSAFSDGPNYLKEFNGLNLNDMQFGWI